MCAVVSSTTIIHQHLHTAWYTAAVLSMSSHEHCTVSTSVVSKHVCVLHNEHCRNQQACMSAQGSLQAVATCMWFAHIQCYHLHARMLLLISASTRVIYMHHAVTCERYVLHACDCSSQHVCAAQWLLLVASAICMCCAIRTACHQRSLVQVCAGGWWLCADSSCCHQHSPTLTHVCGTPDVLELACNQRVCVS